MFVTFVLLLSYLPYLAIADEGDNAYTFPFDNLFEDYHDYDEGVSELETFANEYPDIVRLYNLTDLIPAGQTWEGRYIHAVKVSDGVSNEPEYYSDPD